MKADVLTDTQKRLGRTIERARIGEDRQLAMVVREKGEQFANLFYGALRMTSIYSSDNRAFDHPVGEIAKILEWLLAELGVVHLVCVGDQVYVNDIRIRFGRGQQAGAQLGAELFKHNVGSLSFHALLGDDGVRTLVRALGAPPAEHNRRAALCSQLDYAGITGVEIQGVKRFLMAGEELNEPEWSDVLARAATVVEETWNCVGAGRMVNPLALRRVVVELMMANLQADGLWQRPPGDSEHGPHAVRVFLIAHLIGKAVGLSDRTLQDLGIAALVHDVGYAVQETEVAPGTFERHCVLGARVLLRQRGFHEAKVRRVLAILDHHRGYPEIKEPTELLSRILRVADDYDTMTRPGGGALPPPTALARMAASGKAVYDPTLVQLLVNSLGRYPPGTNVCLKSGETGRVISIARSQELFNKPRVLTASGAIVDLAEGGAIVEVY